MLDPDEHRRFEEWRRRRVLAADDLSVEAFNAEESAMHAVWIEGYIAGNGGLPRESNPYPSPTATAPEKEAPLI